MGAEEQAREVSGWWWLTADASPTGAGRPSPFDAPWCGDLLIIVVGDVGTPPADPGDYAQALDQVPPAEWDRVMIAPYGPGGPAVTPLARLLARRWDRPVRFAPGVPVAVGESWRSVVTDDDGVPLWYPPVRMLSCDRDGALAVADIPDTLAGLTQVAPGTYRLDLDWLVTLTPAGVALRRQAEPVEAWLGAATVDAPWEPRWLSIAVDRPDAAAAQALHRLLDRLPVTARARARVALRGPWGCWLSDVDSAGAWPSVAETPGPRRPAPSPARPESPATRCAAPHAPDLVFAPVDVAAPAWWVPDPRVAAVLVDEEPGGVGLRSWPGRSGEVVSPLELAEAIEEATAVEARQRPVVLVAGTSLSETLVQVVADALGTPVLTGPQDQGIWWSTGARRIARGEPAPLGLGDVYPLSADAYATLIEPPECHDPVVPSLPAQAAGVGGIDLVTGDATGVTEAPGWYEVVIEASPDPLRPLLLLGQTAEVWDLALVLWAVRERWQGRALRLPALVDERLARLLAAYLDAAAEVAVARPVDEPIPPVLDEPGPPVPDPTPRVVDVPVAALADDRLGRVSTAAERRLVRQALGGRFEVYSQDVVRTLARMPGLRSAVDGEGVVVDLVAVRAYLAGSTVDAEPHRSALRGCLVSGLRRLPAVIGPVFLAATDPGLIPVVHDTGGSANDNADDVADLIAVDLVRAVATMPGTATTGALAVVWSMTGRRLDAVTSGEFVSQPAEAVGVAWGAGVAPVVFAPGSRFRVLRVDGAPATPERVYLTECGPGGGGDRLLERLVRAATAKPDGANRPTRR